MTRSIFFRSAARSNPAAEAAVTTARVTANRTSFDTGHLGPGTAPRYRAAARGDRRYNGAMPKPFDATLKELIEAFPTDWLAQIGIPVTGPIRVLSPELSTVTAAADALIRVGDAVVPIDTE